MGLRSVRKWLDGSPPIDNPPRWSRRMLLFCALRSCQRREVRELSIGGWEIIESVLLDIKLDCTVGGRVAR